MGYSDPDAQREYQRLWQAKRRAEWLEGKSCAICGSTDRLELDHVDPATKKMQPSTLWSLSPTNPRRIAELAKCQVLCWSHHLEKTNREKLEARKHGRSWYNKGCRCEVCKEAQRKHNAQRTQRKHMHL